MKRKPDDDVLENAISPASSDRESENLLRPFLSRYIQDTVQKCETRLKIMEVPYVEHKFVRCISVLMQDNFKKPTSGAAAAKGKNKGKGKRNSGDHVQWTTKGQCSREDKCGLKHDPEKKPESKGKKRPALYDGVPWKEGTTTAKSFTGKESQPTH